ncbi:MAG TPA: monovalent cation/H(+) antiporter subunit G, partial [Myxococcota bacterium]|nr:monovalent cation/H(+) antiporter subunit G [Myxococcota bacterium]
MTTAFSMIAASLLVTGAFFFLAGSLGILRFPDVFSRLHALTKADNVGLGLIALGIAIERGSLVSGLRLLSIWLLVLLSTAVVSHLIARSAKRAG